MVGGGGGGGGGGWKRYYHVRAKYLLYEPVLKWQKALYTIYIKRVAYSQVRHQQAVMQVINFLCCFALCTKRLRVVLEILSPFPLFLESIYLLQICFQGAMNIQHF